MSAHDEGRAVRVYTIEPVIERCGLGYIQGYTPLQRAMGVPRVKHYLWCVERLWAHMWGKV
jgi:hypothetical protein